MSGDVVGGQDRMESKKNHLYEKHTLHDALMLRGLNSDVMMGGRHRIYIAQRKPHF